MIKHILKNTPEGAMIIPVSFNIDKFAGNHDIVTIYGTRQLKWLFPRIVL